MTCSGLSRFRPLTGICFSQFGQLSYHPVCGGFRPLTGICFSQCSSFDLYNDIAEFPSPYGDMFFSIVTLGVRSCKS